MFRFKTDRIDFSHKIDIASEPSEEYEKHMHIFCEVLYFVKGDVEYTVESETHKLQKGDIVLIPAGKYHFATINKDVTYERYVLKTNIDILPPHLKESLSKDSYFFTNTGVFSHHFQNLDNYYQEYESDELETMFLSEFAQMIIKVLHNPVQEKIEHNEFISNLISYIDDNIQSKITLDTLSNQFNFSKSYISSEFKKQMKTPVIHYIKTKKIIAAHQLILQGVSKTKVAEMFGFDEYSTFYRAYTKIINNN
ncbi:MAG: AraC family transcriptional regulator [Bacilli bacterium]|nr:AraC family transcriptional regulator [Bacilli bacterium]